MESRSLPLPETPPAPPAPRDDRRPVWRRALGLLTALGLLVLKFGAKLKALLLLVPKLKLFTTSATMLVSVAAYALIWGWRFAAGFVVLLLVHEMGHVIQLRREGIKASAPMFIPFLGALVAMKELPKDAAAEARVGLAGPVLGSLGALVPLGLWAVTGDELFQALAFVGFFLNLFNLLPVLPLDGGRAMAALSPWMWVVGYGLLVGATVALPQPHHAADPALRRPRDLAPLAAAQDAGGPRLQPCAPGHARRGRGGLPWAGRRSRGGHGRHLPGAGLQRRLGPPTGTVGAHP